MNIEELYHFLFETMPGIGILVGGGLVISIIVCFILERMSGNIHGMFYDIRSGWKLECASGIAGDRGIFRICL